MKQIGLGRSTLINSTHLYTHLHVPENYSWMLIINNIIFIAYFLKTKF